MRPKKNAPGEMAAASARPASTPEAQEQYMINLAMTLVEKRLREGTASSRNNAFPETGDHESRP